MAMRQLVSWNNSKRRPVTYAAFCTLVTQREDTQKRHFSFPSKARNIGAELRLPSLSSSLFISYFSISVLVLVAFCVVLDDFVYLPFNALLMSVDRTWPSYLVISSYRAPTTLLVVCFVNLVLSKK